MIRLIEYGSQRWAVSRTNGSNAAILSILDANSTLQRPDPSIYRRSLFMSFKDRSEEEYPGAPPWPDEPDDYFNYFVLGEKGERLFSLSDAQKIISFYENANADPEVTRFIVHCRVGVSRSSAIASWLGENYGVRWQNEEKKRFSPNARVLRLLNKASTG